MSRFLGQIRQLGYVVPDIQSAMIHWTEVMGVGPFYYNPHVPIENYSYDGVSYDIDNAVALGNSGFVQVELIQTLNDAPSMYRDFIQEGNTGLQHIAYWTKDFDNDLATMEGRGFKVKMSGQVGSCGRFVYFDKHDHPGTVIELSEVVGPKGQLFKTIYEESLDWDGANPVRNFPSLT